MTVNQTATLRNIFCKLDYIWCLNLPVDWQSNNTLCLCKRLLYNKHSSAGGGKKAKFPAKMSSGFKCNKSLSRVGMIFKIPDIRWQQMQLTRKKMLTSTTTKNSLKIWEFSPVSEHRVASTLFYVILTHFPHLIFPSALGRPVKLRAKAIKLLWRYYSVTFPQVLFPLLKVERIVNKVSEGLLPLLIKFYPNLNATQLTEW